MHPALGIRCALSAIVGVGPIEYLVNWRLARAKDELRQGLHSIAQIAFNVGFQSTSARS
jgi:transcriptional regulator GlxA family with amidase domain